MKKNKKQIALILTAALLTNGCTPSGQALSFKKIKDLVSNNMGVKNLLKYTGAAIGAAAGGTALYYGGRKALDFADPGRSARREAIKKAKEELKDVNEKFAKETNLQKQAELSARIGTLQSVINQKSSLTESVKNIPVVGGAVASGGLALGAIENAGKICRKILNISYLKYAWDNAQMAKNKLKGYFEIPAKEFNKEEVFANFDSVLKDVHGQEEALETLKNYIYDIVVGKNQAKWKGEKYKHGDVLYFHGPSGVGKSSVSEKIPYMLYSNPKIYTVTTSDVDKDQKDSVVTQLFQTTKDKNAGGYYGPPPTEKTKDLVDFLKNNPNGIIKIEEYDKICTPALDEIFRNIMEFGMVNVGGEKIDCSGMLFIMTSNEDKTSMEGFDKKDKDSEAEKMDKESFSQGYTRVWHDKSFLNRIKKVEFGNLSPEAYAIIIRKHFNRLSEYWLDPRNAGIKLVMNDEIITSLSERVAKMNQGARPIDLEILPALQVQIGNKIKSAPSFDAYNGKTFQILYDENQKTFDIEVL